jgi:PiT family inorganic phosphate transporter
MMTPAVLFGMLLALIFCFTLTNGFLDGGGIVSTVITTRAMEPLPALMLVACCEVVGVFLFGHAVIRTIGLNMITFPPAAPTKEVLSVLLAGTAGALVWNSAMWRFSWPSSSSHALLGGLLGATWTRFGQTAIAWPVVIKVLIGLAAVPLLAALISFALARLLYWAGQYLTPAMGGLFRWLHIIVLAGVALVHGSNDGQKSMALVLLAFLACGWGASGAHLPVWVGLSCGLALGLGVVFGSKRTVHTVGQGLYRMQNLQGLCAESAAMLLVAASSIAGYPMSTSHVMSSSVIGAGAAVRPRDVRWDLAGNIVLAWLLTIPAAAGVAGTLSYVVSKAF